MLAPIRRTARFVAQLEIWLVLLAIAASIIWPGFLPAAVLTAAFFWPVRRIAHGHFSLRTPGDWAILLILLMLLLTLYITGLPEKTWTQVWRLLSGILLYYAVVNWCDTSRRLRWSINSTILVGLLLACMTPVSITWAIGRLQFTPSEFYRPVAMLVTDAVHPNVMAGSLVLLFPIPLAYLMFSWRALNWLERALSILSLAVMLTALGLTRSRGAWMATGFVVVVLLVLRWRWMWVGLVLAAGLAMAVFNRVGIATILEFLASDRSIGVEERLDIWSRSVYMLQDFAFTGVGMGSFTEIADTFYPFSLALRGTIYHAHNLFLQIAIDLGIIGLIAWLAVLLTILVLSWQLYHPKTSAQSKIAVGIGAGLVCSQLALLVHGLTDAVTWGMVRPAPLVWALWGLATAAWGIYTRRRSIFTSDQS